MSHDEALCILAAERYLLKEFDDRLREAFEEHFFDCSECAADMRAAANFLDAVKRLADVIQTRPVDNRQTEPRF